MASFFKAKAKSKKSHDEEQFPNTLLDFGYEFDKDGKIQNVETGEGFQFVVKEGDQSYNQRHYEALGEVVTNEVYKLLETECKLKKAPVPYTNAREDNSTFIFLSEDALSNPDKLLVLIHGSGVVRAGQWSRRLIINDSLKSGTQIPFIQEAQKEGYGILVTNTNDNHRPGKGKIKGSENPESHALHVWKHYIRGAKAKHIAIIAHSYGGCVVTSLYTQVKEEFMRRVFAVAMTDSVHYLSDPKPYKDLLKVSRNWVCSQEPLDTPVKTHSGDITRVSAGVTVHEQTSWVSFRSIFEFLRERLMVAEGNKGVTDSEEGRGKDTTDLKSEKESLGKFADMHQEGDSRGCSLTEEEKEEGVKKMRVDN